MRREENKGEAHQAMVSSHRSKVFDGCNVASHIYFKNKIIQFPHSNAIKKTINTKPSVQTNTSNASLLAFEASLGVESARCLPAASSLVPHCGVLPLGIIPLPSLDPGALVDASGHVIFPS